MRSSALTCAAAMVAALMGQASGIAQTMDPSDVKRLLEEEKRHPHMIAGVEVRAAPRNMIAPVDVRARRRNMISPVDVNAPRKCLRARRPADPGIPPPTLVSTFPANGAVVRPGLLVVRMTFDLPMACPGLMDRHSKLLNPCPAPLDQPVISLDKRTFLTVCRVAKGSHYGLWLRRFTSQAGYPSSTQELVFDTSSEPEVAKDRGRHGRGPVAQAGPAARLILQARRTRDQG